MPSATIAPATSIAAASTAAPPRNGPPAAPPATDDEILGIVSPRKNAPRDAAQLEFDFDAAFNNAQGSAVGARHAVPDRDAWHLDAHSQNSVVPPALRNEGSEASAVSPSGLVQPVRADAQSRNLSSADHAAEQSAATDPEPAHLRAAFDANPELRAAWRDANSYRESFATPEAAREATALLVDMPSQISIPPRSHR
jgi:hypothetical protein